MEETRTVSERYAAIGGRLVGKHPALRDLHGSSARIVYLASDRAKKSRGKSVFAECERVPAKYRWAIPYDFAVTVYEPNTTGFDDKRLEVLMLHELMHAGVAHGKDGAEVFRIVPHDIEDFAAIIDEHGRWWWR